MSNVLPFNNQTINSYFTGSGAGTMRGLADATTDGSTIDLTAIGAGVTSAVTGVLTAENAQNQITQANVAETTLNQMLPMIIIGIGTLLFLNASKK